MNVVQSGAEYMVYSDDDLRLHKDLPVGTYTICFDKMRGYSLRQIRNLENDSKMYGRMTDKISKVIEAFDRSDRNLGVGLVGDKGLGKSMFIVTLEQEAIRRGLPVILVSENTPGLTEFIDSIEGLAVVIFDEFDKNFASATEYEDEFNTSAQNSLLTLFDNGGTSESKKLFVVACNKRNGVSQYFISRPGRLYYMFKFAAPDVDVIKEYFEDNLTAEGIDKEELAAKCALLNFSFDILRAIVDELNNGYSLKETLEDLNIEIEFKYSRMNVLVYYKNGDVLTDYTVNIENFISNDATEVSVRNEDRDVYVSIVFGNPEVRPLGDGVFDVKYEAIRDYGIKLYSTDELGREHCLTKGCKNYNNERGRQYEEDQIEKVQLTYYQRNKDTVDYFI